MFYYGQRSKCADLLNSYNITNIKRITRFIHWKYHGVWGGYFMKRYFMLLFAMVMIPYVTTLAWTGRIRTDVGESIPTEEFLVGMVAAEIPAEYGIRDNEGAGRAHQDVCVPDRGSRIGGENTRTIREVRIREQTAAPELRDGENGAGLWTGTLWRKSWTSTA